MVTRLSRRWKLDSEKSRLRAVEISQINLSIAKKRIVEQSLSKKAHIEYVLGDAEKNISRLVDFARLNEVMHPIFWLDAHTHVFEDGTLTDGNPCSLISEIAAINQAFNGKAVLLIDDIRMRIIDAKGAPPRGIRGGVQAARNALFNPNALISMIKPGGGKFVDLLTILKMAMEVPDVSFCLLDGIEPLDVLCVYPNQLHESLFAKNCN